MQNNISKVHQQPTIFRLSFHAAADLERLLYLLYGSIGKGLDHAVTGPGTYDEVFSKNCDILNIDQDDVFPLFVF